MNIKEFLKPSKKTLLIVVLLIVIIFIFKYNDFFGHSCNNDMDCKFKCGAGAINNRFFYFGDPFVRRDCWPAIGICENKRCQVLSPYIATSIENCEKIRQKKPQWVGNCYYFLAHQLIDISLCDKIDEISRREQCIGDFKEIK